MPRNTLADLNNLLFAQLERLDDDELSFEDLKNEINRSKAMAAVATNIVKNNEVALDALKLKAEYCDIENDLEFSKLLLSNKEK